MNLVPGNVLVRAGVIICLLAALLVTSWPLKDVPMAPLESADVKGSLPDTVGVWEGEAVWYCQQESCAQSFRQSDLANISRCPSCTGRLDQISLGERTLLPADTIVLRKVYRNPQGLSVHVTVVISGNDQKSIHRPQQCLPAQGFAIDDTWTMSVPLAGKAPFKLTAMASKRGARQLVFAYWFMGGGHETHDHFKRLSLMAWDNIIHGIRSRWAYVSVQTDVSGGVAQTERILTEFVKQLYPVIRRAY
jgi:EpsI family protein